MKATMKQPAGRALVLETLDGRAYLGNTVEECVRAMRRDAWACEENSLRAYMEGVARRAQAWCKVPCRHDTAANLVNDLQAAGLVTLGRLS